MNKVFPQSYPIYEKIYGTDFPSEQYFIISYDELPSKYENNSKTYDELIEHYFISKGFVKKVILQSTNTKSQNSCDILLENTDKQILIELISFNKDKEKLFYKIKFIYNIKNGDITEQIDFNQLIQFEIKRKKSNIGLIKSDMGNLDVEEYNLDIPEIDVKLNYGSNFLKIHETIINTLNKPNGKGIVLLHGDPGTGKTSYIKYLTSLIEEKEVLFVPPFMAEMLSEPTVIPFLMDYRNSILIIEDAERVISDRETNGSSNSVSNILNLTDGILSDCLNIQIVATFNMKKENIDSALLRKGRLIAEHKFEKLTVDETNKLLKSLNKDIISEVGLTLADIYNIDVEVHKSKTKTKIGLL